MTHHHIVRTVAVLLCATSTANAEDRVHVDVANAGMVVSDSALASRVGRSVLMDGGNAVDAAVATAFALAVTWPEAGNIGGGGFMVIRPADGQNPVCVDYRETAPLAITRTSFTKTDSTFSQKAVGVPGTVRGLSAAHTRYGVLPWRRLVMPAVQLARDGFQVTESLAQSTNNIVNKIESNDGPQHAELLRIYRRGDEREWQAGDRMQLPDLANTLDAIAEHPDAFYTGRLADLLVKEMKRGNGLISHRDLQQYQAIIRPAMIGHYRNYTIIGAPPPSSGGTCIIQALNILENFKLNSTSRFSARSVHLIAEASRYVFADRARHVGDPAFTGIPSHLTKKSYARKIAQKISEQQATPSADVAPEITLAPESPNTTHFSVVDGEGMAVSNTYTLENSWGSRIVVSGAGYVLNNEMGDFNWFPGITERTGRIGTEPNTVAPGKRMLSSQSPTIVEKDGQLLLVTGSPGGRTIINTTLCVILNVIEFGMNVADAVKASRQHHQWFPDRLFLEDLKQAPHAPIANALWQMGHVVENRDAQGSAHTIAVDSKTGQLVGVADYRRSGRPAGTSTGTSCTWDFAERPGQSLQNTKCTGGFSANWSCDESVFQANGHDQLLLHGSKSRSRIVASLDLSDDVQANNSASATISVTVALADVHFSGTQQDELFSIGFTTAESASAPLAAVQIGRRGDDSISLATINGVQNDGATLMPLSPSNRLSEPVEVSLTLNPDLSTFEVTVRSQAQPEFNWQQTGSLSSTAAPTELYIALENEISVGHEFVKIDRIRVRRF